MSKTQEVTVTAADFNGEDWDGSPFSAGPSWLLDALMAGQISPDTPNCTDYAEWWVKTPYGKVLASPGDIIRSEAGTLSVNRPVGG